jgi:hypothetical protein
MSGGLLGGLANALFGGGGDGGSTSSTTQTTTNQNPVSFATNGAESSATAINGSNNNVNQSFVNMDASVANHAMDNMLTSNQDSLLFAHDAQVQAYKFASDSQASSQAFAAASNAQTMSFAKAQTDAANAMTVTAVGNAKDALTEALNYGAKQTGVALDALAGSAAQINTAYADAKGVLSTKVIMVAMVAGAVVLVMALQRK